MVVLFVRSGNRWQESLTTAQADSLKEIGVQICIYDIKGRGILGYFSNVKKIRKSIRENRPDVIHAHYSFSAFITSFAGAKPIVVSLMGSDVEAKRFYPFLIRCFAFLFSWEVLLVKSEKLKQIIKIDRIMVIPNGVNMHRFIPIDQSKCRVLLGWDETKRHILFASNPERTEKNYKLAELAISLLNKKEVQVHLLQGLPQDIVPVWYNAADVVLLTSLREGSPNVIKEAMACNRPIVATNVGDIEFIFGSTAGCFLTTFDPQDVADNLEKALSFSKQTNGKERISALGLDEKTIAGKILEIYESVSK